MDHSITNHGVETFGVLTPWSEITAITLVRERDVVHEGVTITQAHWMIVVDLATGDFLEITEKSPVWRAVLDGLQQHCILLVDDLAGLIAEGCASETILWRG